LQAQLKKGPQLALKSGGKLIVASIFLFDPFCQPDKGYRPIVPLELLPYMCLSASPMLSMLSSR
jgi:hypothetical protein